MSVHEAITSHSNKQHRHLAKFTELDAQREQAIEEAVSHCRNGQLFSVDLINAITAQINAHAKHGISPTRQYVTEDLVREFVNRSK